VDDGIDLPTTRVQQQLAYSSNSLVSHPGNSSQSAVARSGFEFSQSFNSEIVMNPGGWLRTDTRNSRKHTLRNSISSKLLKQWQPPEINQTLDGHRQRLPDTGQIHEGPERPRSQGCQPQILEVLPTSEPHCDTP
jgi:hypothetical protein